MRTSLLLATCPLGSALLADAAAAQDPHVLRATPEKAGDFQVAEVVDRTQVVTGKIDKSLFAGLPEPTNADTGTVSDPGHLVNSAYSLPEPLQVALSKTSWTGPVANERSTSASSS